MHCQLFLAGGGGGGGANDNTSELTHPCDGERKFSNAAKLNHRIKCFFSLRWIGITKTGVRMTTQQDVHITTAGTAAFHNLKNNPSLRLQAIS